MKREKNTQTGGRGTEEAVEEQCIEMERRWWKYVRGREESKRVKGDWRSGWKRLC